MPPALPRPTERVSLTALPTGSSVGTDTVHLSLPAALLCNRSYGSPVRAGYIVYRGSRPGAGVYLCVRAGYIVYRGSRPGAGVCLCVRAEYVVYPASRPDAGV